MLCEALQGWLVAAAVMRVASYVDWSKDCCYEGGD